MNFNEIKLPQDKLGYGVKSLDLLVSSIEKETHYKTLPGLPGNIDGGTRDASRSASIHMLLQSRDSKDFHLKVDEIYSFFRNLDVFYVSKSMMPHKLLKVRVSGKYDLERPSNLLTWSDFNIELDVVGSPYKISQYKTMDIHYNGVDLKQDKWDVGMGLIQDEATHKYLFENTTDIRFWNAGDVTLKTIQEYQDCIIKITALTPLTTFFIRDNNWNEFIYNPEQLSEWYLKAGDVITINGPHIKKDDLNILNRTNIEWLEIVKGWNKYKCSPNLKIELDFRFKYD
ncbi:phage tail family protein [Macrococcus armenti]|uniref:phage tail domain-containing protein n=1 Tax=Macrococcus armenti TaxID=2875764 RepID=UPI001CCFE9A0|nr:phage tail domain-containing protein [Macrococcus armenti]UBH21561.1 phage tail family protein [Macrococcus armenti]